MTQSDPVILSAAKDLVGATRSSSEDRNMTLNDYRPASRSFAALRMTGYLLDIGAAGSCFPLLFRSRRVAFCRPSGARCFGTAHQVRPWAIVCRPSGAGYLLRYSCFAIPAIRGVDPVAGEFGMAEVFGGVVEDEQEHRARSSGRAGGGYTRGPRCSRGGWRGRPGLSS